MDKKTIITFVLIGGAVIALAVFIFFQSPVAEINFEELDQKITYYYGDNCPHCQNVLQFMEENKIEEKVDFSKKEVSQNDANSREFLKVVKKCGIDPSEAGVPLVYAEGKCFLGEPEATNFFKKKAGISQQ